MVWATSRQLKRRFYSRLDGSRSGRLVLNVSYLGDEFNSAIEQAIRDYGLGDRADVTVMAVPAGFSA